MGISVCPSSSTRLHRPSLWSISLSSVSPFLIALSFFLFFTTAPSPVSPFRLLTMSSSLLHSFSPWHQCKASIIKRCMGVCVSGRGTWHSSCPTCRGSTDSWAQGAHLSPSSSAYLHISSDLPPPLTPSLSYAPSPALPLFPLVPHTLAQFLPVLTGLP